MQPKILCLSGSLRSGSSATALVRAIIDRYQDLAAFELADLRVLPHYDADLGEPDVVAGLKQQVAAAAGLLIVTPEYNYSVPGFLKNAIDWLSRPAYQSVLRGKRTAIVSVSGGALGGVRAQAHLKYILNGVLADIVMGPEIVVPKAHEKVKDGVFADTEIVAFCEAAVRGLIQSP